MNVGAVVQARMSSGRLPGKVLLPLAGRPLLAWLFERLAHAASLDGLILATSEDETDDPVAAWAAVAGIPCHRGSLEDVASRMADAGRVAGFDVIVRVSGDSPLLDPAVVDLVVGAFVGGDLDIATNVQPRTFPTGQSVEVLPTMLLDDAAAEMTDPEHREHVLPWFYEAADRYRIGNVVHHRDLSSVRMTVDTEDDLRSIDATLRHIAALGRPSWTFGVDELTAIMTMLA